MTAPEVIVTSEKIPESSRQNLVVASSESIEKNRNLHSGHTLGNLPPLKPSSPTKLLAKEMNEILTNESAADKRFLGSPLTRDAESKKNSDTETNTPQQYLCELTRRLMTEPVKTIYGNVYDKEAILNWFSKQGRICPLTGNLSL